MSRPGSRRWPWQRGWAAEAAHSQFAAAVDVVLHLGFDPSGRRYLREVGVPERGADGLVTMASAVTFDAAGRLATVPVPTGSARLLDDA